MVIKQSNDVEAVPVNLEGAKGATKRLILGSPDSTVNFSTRLFELEPGGHTPYHVHDFEHEIYVLHGTGAVKSEQGETPVSEGTAAYIPGGEYHQLINKGSDAFRFLCIVLKEYE